MIYFNSSKIAEMQKSIDPQDLHENGVEDEHHTTLLYGLHSDEIADEKVMNICTGADYGPIKLRNPSLFENQDFDVLKFDAEARSLNAVNAELTQLPHTNNFPDYHPHATVAYLKPGTGKSYIEKFSGMEETVQPIKIVYSKPGGEKVEKSLHEV